MNQFNLHWQHRQSNIASKTNRNNIFYAAERQHIVHIVFRLVHFISIGGALGALSFILSFWLYILSYHFVNGQHCSGRHFHSDNVKINVLNIFVCFRFALHSRLKLHRPSIPLQLFTCEKCTKHRIRKTIARQLTMCIGCGCAIRLAFGSRHRTLYKRPLFTLVAQTVMFRGTSKR